jgi:transcription elongation GreA/GreB family factor
MRYQIVGSDEADPARGAISSSRPSPDADRQEVGDEVKVQARRGRLEIRAANSLDGAARR